MIAKDETKVEPLTTVIAWEEKERREERRQVQRRPGQNEEDVRKKLLHSRRKEWTLPQAVLRMRGVQQPSDGSKFLKRTKNALAGLAENVHLLFLSSVELYVTQIKGYCSRTVSKAEVGSANLNEQPQRSSSTLGNWGGIPEGLLLKKAGAGLLLGHLRNMQAHELPLDPWVKPTATLHSFFFFNTNSPHRQDCPQLLCEMDTQCPTMLHASGLGKGVRLDFSRDSPRATVLSNPARTHTGLIIQIYDRQSTNSHPLINNSALQRSRIRLLYRGITLTLWDPGPQEEKLCPRRTST